MGLIVHSQDLEIPEKARQESDLLKVFIDCIDCDMNFLKQEIDYVNHVRDQSVAEVHIFITSIYTASGGRLFEMSFKGRESFSSVNNTFEYTSLTTSTYDEIRKELKKNIELGLIPYLLHTNLASNLNVTLKDRNISNKDQTQKDPWHNWLFDTDGQISLYQQQGRKNFRFYTGAEAERVTEEWRIGIDYTLNTTKLEALKDSTISIYPTHRTSINSRTVKSLGNHWSAGASSSFYSSTYSNMDHSYSIGPAFEYSYYPYAEALKKEITLAYRLRYVWHDYIETTFLDRDQYEFASHSLYLNIRYRQPWGSIRSSISGSHHLNNFDYRRVEFYNWLSIRIFKGLSISLRANFKIIRDQIYLPKEDATLEEVLLGQVSIPTSYELSLSGGLSYTFGSIYNNIVNTRL